MAIHGTLFLIKYKNNNAPYFSIRRKSLLKLYYAANNKYATNSINKICNNSKQTKHTKLQAISFACCTISLFKVYLYMCVLKIVFNSKIQIANIERSLYMNYSHEVENMCVVKKGPNHGPAPIPEEGKWVKAYQISDISGLSHGIGWCAPQQGGCKLTLNVKDGIIEEALVETIGCSGMTHSAAMAGEILPGKTLLEALNTDLVCDAINVAMREIFKQLVYGRTQTAFSEGGLPVGAALEDLGKGLRSQVGTIFSTKAKGVRYLEMAEGYILSVGLKDDQPIGYKFVRVGKMLEDIRNGVDPKQAYEQNISTYGRYDEAEKYIDPRNQ